MSYIHFKSVYNLNFDKVAFDGTSISLVQLKKLIADKQKFSKQIDYDLEITNADTNQVYQNENEKLLKNSRVLVKRIVKNSSAPIRPQVSKVTTVPTPAPVITTTPQVQPTPPPKPVITQPVGPPKPVYDSLAPLNIPSKPIVYIEEPVVVKPIEHEIDNRMDERAKLESIMMSSMTKLTPEQSLTNKFLGINNSRLKPQTINPADRPIPPGYLCVTCRKPGHLKQFCPEAGTLPRPEERPKFPSGIPRTNLRPAQAGDKFAMLGPEGYVVTDIDQAAAKIVKKDKVLFDDEDEDELKKSDNTSQDHEEQIPKELQCPFGGHLIKDAVLVPCCGHFVCCDECIKQKIVKEEAIECPNEKCDQEMGPLASITPFHEIRKKCQEYLKRSCKSEQSSKDAFLDLILDDVNNKNLSSNLLANKLSPNGCTPKSPVQDSKITSSEKMILDQSLQVNTVLAPKIEDVKTSGLSPGQILTLPNKPQNFQFQPRPPRPNYTNNFNPNFRQNIVPLTNNQFNQGPPRPMMPNYNQMYRPPFQQQFDPMGVPLGVMPGPMGGPMMPPVNPGFMPPGMMPGQMQMNMYQTQMMPPIVQPSNGPMPGIMSEKEYYEYREKLKKEAEMKLRGSYKRSRSKSRGRYSKSRSRSPGRYKSNRYRRSRSRNRSRDRNVRRHSRSRSRRRSRSRNNRDRKTVRTSSRDSKSRSIRGSSRDSKSRTIRDSSRHRSDKREDSKLKSVEEIVKPNDKQVSDGPVEKKKKLDQERKVESDESSSSDKESGKESSGSGKKHKHKHKKSKKKHKHRSSSKH